MKLYLLILFSLISSLIFGQQPSIKSNLSDSVYVAESKIQLHPLQAYCSVFVDSSNTLDFKEVASPSFRNSFKPISTANSIAMPKITYWIKCSIKASGDINNWWLILNDDTAAKSMIAANSYVDAWFVNGTTNSVQQQKTGLYVPRSAKLLKEKPGLNRLQISLKDEEIRHVFLKVFNGQNPAGISALELRNPLIGLPSQRDTFLMKVSTGIAFVFATISLFFFFFVRDKAYLYFALYSIFLGLHYLALDPAFPFTDLFIPEHPHLLRQIFLLLTSGTFILFALFGKYFINLSQLSKRLTKVLNWGLVVWSISIILVVVVYTGAQFDPYLSISIVFIVLLCIFLIRVAFFKSTLARIFVAGALWLFIFTILGLLVVSGKISLGFSPFAVGQIGQLLIYVAGLAYKIRLNEKASLEAELIRIRNTELGTLYAESKKQKEEIEIQKSAAENALKELKATQSQLIQSEKMASLGELTAGIAHEIQNPLNFVNNFSEVNKELSEELAEEVKKGDLEEIELIAKDIKENSEKINHHGKRADAIVKGMLQHSRSSSGIKELTDINALCDEYLRLSYHGLRASDKSFNAKMVTDFDDRIGKVNVVAQDISRVILNLLNNAFYACTERSQSAVDDKIKAGDRIYEPTVTIRTKKLNEKIEITVSDNGNGIPDAVKEKIFQPFFTTKPTGKGTGLGLSLAYDIVKAHGGEVKVETKEDGGTTFFLSLPTGENT